MVEHAVPEGSDVRVGELVCIVETDDPSVARRSSSASQQSVPG